jgi:hypothetical protein
MQGCNLFADSRILVTTPCGIKHLSIPELSNEQRRQLIDAQQLFQSWRPLVVELNARRTVYWNTTKGIRYLYSKRNGVRTPLGRETPELAQQKADHDARGKRLRQLIRPLAAKLDRMAPVNRALRIGRLPALPARILRELDDRGLLGDHIIVAGTNALYAYETAAGAVIGGEFVATGDADLLWDARRSLKLAGPSIIPGGLLGLLRGIDATFEAHYGYNAANSEGYIVDLITPDDENLPTKLGGANDLEATPMEGAKWLLDSPRFEQIIVAADGLPLRIVAPEPRTFALHKLWLSRRANRQPIKKPRDEAQARLVAELAKTFLGLSFAAPGMPWLSAELKTLARELA